MLVLKLAVMCAMLGTAAFFTIYILALEQGEREGRRKGQVMHLDDTGRTLVFAARTGFIVGLCTLTASSLWGAFSL